MGSGAASSENAVHKLWRHAQWAVRDRWPDRPVVREVQGVRMHLPWSHRLPDYARWVPSYGQNLVRLAELLHDGTTPLTVLDVGANVGDSTLQILDATDARVLCVEADGYFLDYLRRNVDGDGRVAVEPALLSADDDDVAMSPVRVGGTTRFEPGTSELTAPTVTVSDLRGRHPDFSSLRLAKSDTDGYDVQLIPAIARVWADSKPALFFEYDLELSAKAGNDPQGVWTELGELGYTHMAAWDNWGDAVGRWSVAEAGSALTDPGDDPMRSYWDVAVVHEDDSVGRAALDALVP